ncbi:MAG: MYPU_1760 family metalloprotease [Metamycoplasmataceae bacterium]
MKLKGSKLWNFLNVIFFIFCGVGIGTGVFYLTKYIIQTQNEIKDNTFNANEQKIELPKDINNPIKIIEYTTLYDKDTKEPIYFFGQDGIKALSERIKKDLLFGPEVEDLQVIYINRTGVLGNNVSGQYIPLTKEMDLNINQYLPDAANYPIVDKVNLVFPTLFHEYFHHFEAFYLNNVKSNDKNATKLVNNKFISTKFIEEWKNIFHYNDERKLINPGTISNISSPKDLFYGANIPGYNLNNIPENVRFQYGATNNYIDKNDILYLYSFSELFTRKITEAFYQVDSHNNSSYPWYGFIGKNYWVPNAFSIELMRNRSFRVDGSTIETAKASWNQSNYLYSLDTVYGGQAVFTDKTKENVAPVFNEFNSLLNSIYGVGSNISQIFIKNNLQSKLRPNGSLIIDPVSKANFNLIKFTGFVDTKDYENLNSILIDNDGDSQNNTDNEINVFEKIEINKPNYNYSIPSTKINPFGTTRVVPQNYKPYTISEYIDINKIRNKPLYFWLDRNKNNIRDKNELVQIKNNINLETYRPTSSYRNFFDRSLTLNKNNILFTNDRFSEERWN